MNLPEKIRIATLPTRIERLERFTKYMDIPVEIYIKRDDETGIYATGNKIRKLEYISLYAIKNGYDTLITCGGIQSNHSRTTAYLGATLGLDAYLVLKGKEPLTLDGNYLMDKLFGAEIKWVSEEEYAENIDEILQDLKDYLKSKDKKPLVIPEGASYPLGLFGYIEAAKEIKEQLDVMGISMDYIVSSVGSGGTFAGFLLGQSLFKLETEMYGINVCDSAEFFINKIHKLILEFNKLYPEYSNTEIQKDSIKIIDGYIGKGYGIPYEEEMEIIKVLAKTEGIILDPVYTGKAFYGMLKEVKKGTFKENSRILFVHTGGIYSIFPQKKHFIFTG